MAERNSPSFWSTLVLLSGMIMLAVVLAFGYVFLIEPRLLSKPSDPAPMVPLATPFFWPAIQQPLTYPPAAVDLKDDEEVIGVSAAGKHRAYLVSAFTGPTRHVVNDLICDLPVTITHCDQTQCTQAFTSDGPSRPLSLSLGGFAQGQMVLRTEEGGLYVQESVQPIRPNSPAFPYASFPHVRTTWKEWKAIHPDTDVYVGLPDAEADRPADPAAP